MSSRMEKEIVSQSESLVRTFSSQRETSQERLVDLDEALSNDMCLGDLDPEVKRDADGAILGGGGKS